MNHYSRLLFAAAFAAAIPSLAEAAEFKAEVLHFWTSGSESAALKQFADRFKAAGGEWTDTAIATGEAARTAGFNRTAGGSPPTVMLFNTGAQFNELVSSGLMRSVDDVAKAGKWSGVLPKPILDAITRDGQVYAAPINIHAENWLWYNVEVLKKAGVEPPKSFADILAAAPKLKQAGVIPFAHGAQDWQDHILFDAILLAEAGKDLFIKFYADYDVKVAETPQFRKAVDTFGQLRLLADDGSAGRNWNDTTNLVITGKAAMQVMGDWAKGEFIAAKQTAGKEYGCTVMPGGYVMGGDVFIFPKVKDAAEQTAQVKLAEIVMSPDAQLAFNKIKGSVPVRLDVDTSSLDPCAQAGMTSMKNPANQVLSRNFLTSPDRGGAVRDVVTQYWATKSMTADEFVKKIVSAMKSAS